MKYTLLLIISFLSFSFISQTNRSIGLYNVENLFDTIDDPNKNDSEYLPNSKSEWNSAKYFEKLNHINQVFDKVDIISIDVDSHENLAAHYGVSTLPRFMFFQHNDAISDDYVGSDEAIITQKFLSVYGDADATSAIK